MERSIFESSSNRQVTRYDFGVLDSKGRKIGSRIVTQEETFKPVPEHHRGCWMNLAPGHYFSFQGWVTRDGVEYGAIQSARYFTTRDARHAAISKYLQSAAKRYGGKVSKK